MEIKDTTKQANKLMLDRSSIRNYDKSVKISREEMSNILQDAMTAPSSLNLQPWRFIVIDTPEGKELIKPYMMFNELQWETSSAIIAIYGDYDNFSTTEQIYSAATDLNIMSTENKNKIVDMIKSVRNSFTDERLRESIFLDCGFVGMQIMLSAKNYGYDTNPIGGFMRKELTEALKLDANRYIPIVLLSIGKANESAKTSVRYSVADITEWR